MARATGAKTRIGYSAELRNFLLTKTIRKKHPGYIGLINIFALLPLLTKIDNLPPPVYLENIM
jgi:hypothetical protein